MALHRNSAGTQCDATGTAEERIGRATTGNAVAKHSFARHRLCDESLGVAESGTASELLSHATHRNGMAKPGGDMQRQSLATRRRGCARRCGAWQWNR
nr:MAG TPA: hypothetical protein [Caudoviricetes sp.]